MHTRRMKRCSRRYIFLKDAVWTIVQTIINLEVCQILIILNIFCNNCSVPGEFSEDLETSSETTTSSLNSTKDKCDLISEETGISMFN